MSRVDILGYLFTPPPPRTAPTRSDQVSWLRGHLSAAPCSSSPWWQASMNSGAAPLLTCIQRKSSRRASFETSSSSFLRKMTKRKSLSRERLKKSDSQRGVGVDE